MDSWAKQKGRVEEQLGTDGGWQAGWGPQNDFILFGATKFFNRVTPCASRLSSSSGLLLLPLNRTFGDNLARLSRYYHDISIRTLLPYPESTDSS